MKLSSENETRATGKECVALEEKKFDGVSEEDRLLLERAKRGSVAQVLMRCGRLINEEGLSRMGQRLGVPLRASHMALFPHIDLEGTRMTVLASRLGVSKQAVGQLVDELESWGILERVVDATDRRARRVCFVGGAASLISGLEFLGELEGELRASVGQKDWEELHRLLLVLQGVLDQERL